MSELVLDKPVEQEGMPAMGNEAVETAAEESNRLPLPAGRLGDAAIEKAFWKIVAKEDPDSDEDDDQYPGDEGRDSSRRRHQENPDPLK